MLSYRYVLCSLLILTVLICNGGFAEDVEELYGNKIMDNSFLLEEAYNQELGVIQHIQTFQYLEKSENWEYLLPRNGLFQDRDISFPTQFPLAI